MKAEHITDTNNSFQKSSEGEVSFVRPMKAWKLKSDINFMSFYQEEKSARFPVDDEHELNKI